MADYARLAATAVRLVQSKGRLATLRSETRTGDEWNPTIDVVDTSIKAVFSKFRDGEVDDAVIQASDIKVIMGATTTPTTEMRLIDGGVEYSIVNVTELKPGPVAVAYILQARK